MEDCNEKIIKCSTYEIKIKVVNNECVFYYKDDMDEYAFKFNEDGNMICWAHKPTKEDKV